MSRYEYTGERPTDYSQWHRTLPDHIKAQDIDWVEYRVDNGDPRPVALIETGRWKRAKFIPNQEKIIKQIGYSLDIPCYFVEYAIDTFDYNNNVFKVKNLKNDKTEIMNNQQYSKFIMGL